MRLPSKISALILLAPVSFAAQQKPLFDAPVVVGGPSTRILKTLDLNGDGWADAAGWWQISAEESGYADAGLTVWINDKTGKLVKAPWEIGFPFYAIYQSGQLDPGDLFETGDLNGDGKQDFVIGTRFEVRVYLSNGGQIPTLFLARGFPRVEGLALADFDLDGDLDLAVDAGGILRIYRFNWATQDLDLLSDYSTGFESWGRLIAAELTGDGVPDLLQSGCRVYPVQGGQIQPPVVYPSWHGDGDFRHDVGDIDGDGDLDIVTFRVRDGQPGEYRVLRRTAPNAFTEEPIRFGGPARRLVDLDGDGDLDAVCCGGGDTTPPMNNETSRFRMSWNDGTGNFSVSDSMPGLGSSAIAGVVDLDHDGYVDLVAGRCVYYARGPIRPAFLPFGTRAQSERTLVDFDGESDPDCELTLQGVRVNLGDGTIAASPLSLPPPPAGHVRSGKGMPGDWDGDGVVDMLALLGTPTSPTGLELLRNVGGGTFESKGIVLPGDALLASTPNGVGGFPNELDDSLAVDMDGDGDLDLVRRTYTGFLSGVPFYGHWSSWYRNDGAAGFTFAGDFPDHLVLAVADLNGDAFPDLIAIERPAQASDPTPLQWAAGMAGGGFNRWAVIPDTSTRWTAPLGQVAIADLDGDGDQDIAYTCNVDNTHNFARIHWNDGFGHFDRDTSFFLDLDNWAKPGAALAKDLNGDGLVDLAFGPVSNASSAVAIYLRKPDNSGWEAPFQQVVFEAVGTSTDWNSTLSARDVDGDRDMDLITNSVVRNRTFEGADAGQRKQVPGGVAGAGGIVPTLGASGPFRVGCDATLRLRGARPAAHAELLIQEAGSMPATFGIGHVRQGRFTRYIDMTTSGYAYDPPGSGAWSSFFTVPTEFAGRTYRYEVFVEDPAAAGGAARSNALFLAYGP